jgi:hypothetical protein
MGSIHLGAVTVMTDTELKKLLQAAKEASVAAHVEGCPDCVKVMRKFKDRFDPTTCAELAGEVLRLSAENEQLKAVK